MVPTYGLWEDWFDSPFGAEKEQIFFVTVIDHRRHKNVVKTAVTHLSAPLCVTLL